MFFITFYGPPGGIRTHYPRLRRPVLYPDELRADDLRNAVAMCEKDGISRRQGSLDKRHDRTRGVYKET